MVRVVTQETYDEVVRENMEEFDMTPEEAVQEAVAQFEAQGVNLTNIIKDLAITSKEGLSPLERLKKSISNDKAEDLVPDLEVVMAECNKGIAHRIKMGKDGAYIVLIHLLEAKLKTYLDTKEKGDGDVIVKALECLIALMDSQPDLLDNKGVELIKNLLDNIENDQAVIMTLKWTTKCCVKHEMNKRKIFKMDIGNRLKKLLTQNKNAKVISECLQVMRKFTLDDDVRVEFGNTHEHSRDLGILLLVPLMNLLKEHTRPPLVSELMLTIAALLVRHELCKMVADCGVDILFSVLADNYDNVAVAEQGSKLITALAGNDDVKRDLVRSGIVPIIISLLNRHSGNAACTGFTLKCVAALCLREPAHSQQFLENGVPEAIVECLKKHPDNATVQKNACWAIRNMVARCREHNQAFHDLGIQALLNDAYEKYQNDFGFDIKSALRDLDCDIKLDEHWTGKGVQIDQ